jgi:hypothetical protein
MIDFLKIFEKNDNRFPGFGYEMQGIVKRSMDGREVIILRYQGMRGDIPLLY